MYSIHAHGSDFDGECDFVVAHPELGLLALEVKGGAVSYDPKTDRWTSVDRWNIRHNIRDPVSSGTNIKTSNSEKARRVDALATEVDRGGARRDSAALRQAFERPWRRQAA